MEYSQNRQELQNEVILSFLRITMGVDQFYVPECPFYALECPFYAMCIIFGYILSEILLSAGKGGNEKATEELHNMIDMES